MSNNYIPSVRRRLPHKHDVFSILKASTLVTNCTGWIEEENLAGRAVTVVRQPNFTARLDVVRGVGGFRPYSFITHTRAASPLHDLPLLLSIYIPEKPYLPHGQKTFAQTPLSEVSRLISSRVLTSSTGLRS